jgi:hypothetical protein
LRAKGGVWHKKDRDAGMVPHTSIDTEAHWTKSGWHGWVYDWKLHVVCTAAAVWIPRAAALTAANAADNEHAPALIRELPLALRFLLGDQHYRDGALQDQDELRNYLLVTTRTGTGHPYPHTDPGLAVRRILHKTRSPAIENFNKRFKGIFDGYGPVPTRGLVATRANAS